MLFLLALSPLFIPIAVTVVTSSATWAAGVLLVRSARCASSARDSERSRPPR